MQFYELAVGARFVFRGRRYEKQAMSMAEDEDRVGHIFMGDAEVTLEVRGAECGVRSASELLPPGEAARWKPPEKHWTEHLGAAPGQREEAERVKSGVKRDA